MSLYNNLLLDKNNTDFEDTTSIIHNHKYFTSGMKYLKYFGKVNVENVTDEDYKLITEIFEATFRRQIRWRPQSFVSMLLVLILNKPITRIYTTCFCAFKITLTDNLKGKININITKGLFKKQVLSTFIPFKPIINNGYHIKLFRSVQLYRLYLAVKHQVDPFLAKIDSHSL